MKFEKGDIVLTKALRYKDPYWTFKKWIKKRAPLGAAKVIRHCNSTDESELYYTSLQKDREKVVILNRVNYKGDYHGWYFHEDDLTLIKRSKTNG